MNNNMTGGINRDIINGIVCFRRKQEEIGMTAWDLWNNIENGTCMSGLNLCKEMDCKGRHSMPCGFTPIYCFHKKYPVEESARRILLELFRRVKDE